MDDDRRGGHRRFGVTFFGIFLTPLSYNLIQAIVERKKPKSKPNR